MTLTGGATISRSSFQDLQQPFPLTPRVIGRASLHTDWDQYWSTILQWQYIGKRKTRNQSLPAIHNVDMFFHYQYPILITRKSYTFLALFMESAMSFPQQICPAISILTPGFAIKTGTICPNISSAPGRKASVPP